MPSDICKVGHKLIKSVEMANLINTEDLFFPCKYSYATWEL